MSTLSAINPSSVLVLGGTGKTGRRVTSLLGPAARPASRSSATKFDWATPETWEPALAGTNPRQCPIADRVCAEVLSLPMYPALTDDDVAAVIEGINAFRAPVG